MLKSCTSITVRNTGHEDWDKGDGDLGFIISHISKSRCGHRPGQAIFRSSMGVVERRRPMARTTRRMVLNSGLPSGLRAR